MAAALATDDDVNKVGNATTLLVDEVSHVVTDWDTWFDRAADAQRINDEMSSEAEMTSSRARDMLDILVDFDERSQGWHQTCSLLRANFFKTL